MQNSRTQQRGALAFSISVLVINSFACSGGLSVENRPAKQPISFESSDGSLIAADLYKTGDDSAPGLLLVPPVGVMSDIWDSFARVAVSEGYMCLALNPRGARLGPNYLQTPSADSALGESTFADMVVGIDVLIERGADPANIAVIGAGNAANLALRLALQQPRVAALVMLSPGKTYLERDAVEDIKTLRDCPSLVMCCSEDSYGSTSSKAIQEAAPVFCELREYMGMSYGVDILNLSEQARHQALLWLSRIIKHSPVLKTTD